MAEGNGGFSRPVVATAGTEQLRPRARTVVLRAVDAEAATLDFYTDRRSLKVEHLAANPHLGWTCWDDEAQVQFCAGGTARILDDAVCRSTFDSLPKHGRRAYATLEAPGTPLPGPAAGLPADWEDRGLPDTDYARDNFAIIRCYLEWADVLHLDRAGNTRLAARRENAAEPWTFTFIVP